MFKTNFESGIALDDLCSVRSTVLITGGAGFIGSQIAERLIKHRHNILIIDDFTTGREDNIPKTGNIELIRGNVADENLLEKVFKKHKIDYIFHEAAIASVKKTIDYPLESHRTNFDSTLMLLEQARLHKVIKRFVFASSAAVYGDNPSLPKSEKSHVLPKTPYGIDKYASERYVLAYNQLYRLPTSVLRYFNVYGPKQNPDSPYSGVLSIFMKQFLDFEKPKITVYGDGKQTRDFVHVDDVVSANILAAFHQDTTGHFFNVGCGNSKSLISIIKIFEKVSQKKATIKYLPTREGDIKHSSSSISKFNIFGYKPSILPLEGITNYYRWCLNHREY